jgi:hypothetical protein
MYSNKGMKGSRLGASTNTRTETIRQSPSKNGTKMKRGGLDLP